MSGQKVRQTIEELGGTMPEELPTPPFWPDTSIKQIKTASAKVPLTGNKTSDKE